MSITVTVPGSELQCPVVIENTQEVKFAFDDAVNLGGTVQITWSFATTRQLLTYLCIH